MIHDDTDPPIISPRRTRRSIRGRFPRKRTVQQRRITRLELAVGWLEAGGDEPYDKPKTRSECAGGARPCPYVSCRHNLYLDVNPETGSITFNWPLLEPHQLAESCALDVADRGGITLEEIGDVLNVTRERVRQIEVRAVTGKLRGPALALGLDQLDDTDHQSPLAAAQDLDISVVPSDVHYMQG